VSRSSYLRTTFEATDPRSEGSDGGRPGRPGGSAQDAVPAAHAAPRAEGASSRRPRGDRSADRAVRAKLRRRPSYSLLPNGHRIETRCPLCLRYRPGVPSPCPSWDYPCECRPLAPPAELCQALPKGRRPLPGRGPAVGSDATLARQGPNAGGRDAFLPCRALGTDLLGRAEVDAAGLRPPLPGYTPAGFSEAPSKAFKGGGILGPQEGPPPV
jgi:hypothetical protein